MFSKVLNSVENFSNCYCCKSLLTFGSVCCSKLVFKNYYQNFHSGPSFSVNVKNYSHWGPLTQYRNTAGYHCSGSAVPLGCRNRENDKGKAKIRRFAAADSSLAFSLLLTELPKFWCYASVISLCADASCMLLPGLICNLPVHAGYVLHRLILGIKKSTGHCMQASKWSF